MVPGVEGPAGVEQVPDRGLPQAPHLHHHQYCDVGNMDQTDDAAHHIMRGGGGAVERGGEALAGVVGAGGARPGGEGRARHQDDPVEEEPWAPGDRTQETQTP